MQPKLLRFLEERIVTPLGGEPRPVDVRVVAATNRNLEEDVKDGRFREDLFYRLNVIQVTVAPLRERHGAVPLLAQHFLNIYADKNDKQLRGFEHKGQALQIG